MLKKNIFIPIIIALLVFTAIIAIPTEGIVQVLLNGGTGRISIVVDAGHGGIDGGAESRGGICEKDINLSIAQRIKTLAEKNEWLVIMTREKDEGLYSDTKGSIRSKKSEDLHRRQEIINNSYADASVSIHLNSYPSQNVKGAQVFYSASSEEGKIIAEKLQDKIKKELDSENNRTALSKDDILIMKNNTAPLVLLECGFLSNDEEAKKLQDKVYQEKIAEIIVNVFEEYFISIGKWNKKEIPILLSPDE